MLEVELKAWADLEAARARLEALGKKALKRSVKEDTYYGEEAKDPRSVDPLRDRVVRVRTAGARTLVTAKRKAIERGVEVNEEIELETAQPAAARALLLYLGYRPFLKKRKETLAYDWGSGVTVELNRIEGLGELVEVEKLIAKDSPASAVAAAMSEIRDALRALGIPEEKIEPRPYMDLLRERGIA